MPNTISQPKRLETNASRRYLVIERRAQSRDPFYLSFFSFPHHPPVRSIHRHSKAKLEVARGGGGGGVAITATKILLVAKHDDYTFALSPSVPQSLSQSLIHFDLVIIAISEM